MSGPTVVIDRLTATLHHDPAAPPPAEDPLRGPLRQAVAGPLEAALRALDLPPGHWCLARLDLTVGLDLDRPGPALARAWSGAVAAAIERTVREGGPAAPDTLVHYRHDVDLLADAVAGLATGHRERLWAWRQTGILGPAGPAPEAAPGPALLAALERHPRLAAAAVLRAAGQCGLAALDRAWGRDGWQRLAALAEPEEPGAGASDPGTRALARTLLAGSRLAGLVRASRLRPAEPTLAAWAVLVLAETDPAALERPAARPGLRGLLAEGLRTLAGDPAPVRPDPEPDARSGEVPDAGCAGCLGCGADAGCGGCAGCGGRAGCAADGGCGACAGAAGYAEGAGRGWCGGDARCAADGGCGACAGDTRRGGCAECGGAGSAGRPLSPGRPGDAGRARPGGSGSGSGAEGAPPGRGAVPQRPPADGPARAGAGVPAAEGPAAPGPVRPVRPAPDPSDGAATGWAGLLFLLAAAPEAGLPDRALAEPALAARPLSWVLHAAARALCGLAPEDPAALALAGLGPDRAATLLRAPAATPREQDSVDALAADWARATASRLGEERYADDPFGAVLAVARRPGRITAETGWIEAVFASADTDLAVRRAGLDLDPGWLGWLGAVVRYRYV
ncbi:MULTISPECIES: hypothetical protein [unclassified Streptomyces]|uniref:hypothetical protein n=1 Tax=unclassified Streptomyces TaxID=2593676 RepID=UPI00331DD047